MRLTNEGIKSDTDPIFGTSITGAISARERAQLLIKGHSLGDVTRFYGAGIPLPDLDQKPAGASTDKQISHEVRIARSTVMINRVTGEASTLGAMQDVYKERTAATAAGATVVAESVQVADLEDARDAVITAGFNLVGEEQSPSVSTAA